MSPRTRKSSLDSKTDGNITIAAGGGVQIKAIGNAVTIDSNNNLSNQGFISNTDTAGAIGIGVDTSGGDIVNGSGIKYRLGRLDRQGDRKIRALYQRQQHFYGPVTFRP